MKMAAFSKRRLRGDGGRLNEAVTGPALAGTARIESSSIGGTGARWGLPCLLGSPASQTRDAAACGVQRRAATRAAKPAKRCALCSGIPRGLTPPRFLHSSWRVQGRRGIDRAA